ncbi:MAG: hypothetical protein ABIE68_04555 [bacterium]
MTKRDVLVVMAMLLCMTAGNIAGLFLANENPIQQIWEGPDGNFKLLLVLFPFIVITFCVLCIREVRRTRNKQWVTLYTVLAIAGMAAAIGVGIWSSKCFIALMAPSC